MTGTSLLAACLALGLLIYLCVALLRTEESP